jgi:hypothetical protein
MNNYKEVTKEEYYNSFMHLDAICKVNDLKPYPYTVEWTLRNGRTLIAYSEPIDANNYKYFIIKK